MADGPGGRRRGQSDGCSRSRRDDRRGVDDARLRSHHVRLAHSNGRSASRRRRTDGEAADGRRLLRIGNGRARGGLFGRGRRRARLGCGRGCHGGRGRRRRRSRRGRRGRARHCRRRDRCRRCDRRRRRHWSRCSHGDRSRGRGSAYGQVRDGIAVALRLRGDSDAEVEIRPGDLGIPARADRADRLPLVDDGTGGHRDRAEMGQRDGESLRRRDRERSSGPGHGSAERHRPGGRRQDDLARRRRDVDPAVLSAGVRMGRIEDEALEDGPAHGPRPGMRHRRDEKRGQDRDENHTTHRHHLCCQEREQSFPG